MRELDVRKATHFANIPDDWKVVPLLHATKYATGFTPPSGNESYYGDDYPWANISDLDGRRVLSETQRGLSLHAINKFPDERPAPKGSLLFSFKLSLGNVAIAGRDLYTNEAIAAFVPGKELNINYAYYCFPVFLPLYSQTNIYGAELLGGSRFERTKIPLPPLHEQHRIAQYLDRETAEIDATVTDLDKYVGLLEKRKKYQIDLAFAPIIEAKEVAPLGVFYSIANGDRGENYPKAEEITDQGIPFLNAGDIRNRSVILSSAKFVTQEKYETMGGAKLRAGDILFCLRGSLGKHGVVDFDEGSVASSLCVIRPLDSSAHSSHFLNYFMETTFFAEQILFAENGSAQPNLSGESLARFRIPSSTISEQKRIIRDLDRGTAEIDALIEESKKLRDLLLKRRSVLITEVVTGRKQV